MQRQREHRTVGTDGVCVVYCRVSSDKQATEDKGSLDAQEQNGLAKAQALGLRVYRVVKDAESAWILEKRSSFNALLDEARLGRFGVLIVDRMNRLTRSEDLGEYMQVMTLLRDAGVALEVATRDYDKSPLGQMMQMMDAYVSSQEQMNRARQSMQGKRTRVLRDGKPLASGWALYGYQWADAKKERLVFDPGASQAVVRRIWGHFLTAEHPTFAGLAKALNREGVVSPREYAGASRDRRVAHLGPAPWTASTLHDILHNDVYWGGTNGRVSVFRYAKHNEPTTVPAYAPAYITPEEAARVHAILKQNKRFARRNRKSEPDALLYGGIARCGDCGWALSPYTYITPRKDGSLLSLYRCQHANRGNVNFRECEGTYVSVETLDAAVIDALDERINGGAFLEKVFAAWDADVAHAQTGITGIERTLQETETQLTNLAARLATYAPNDPLSAPLEAHARTLAEALPGLRERRDNARAALQSAHANPELRTELGEWFSAWLEGFPSLSSAYKRKFLLAIGATVIVKRTPLSRHPAVTLKITLPTSALRLPPAPVNAETAGETDTPADTWELPVDIDATARNIRLARGWRPIGNAGETDVTQPQTNDDGSAAWLMNDINATLDELAYPPLADTDTYNGAYAADDAENVPNDPETGENRGETGEYGGENALIVYGPSGRTATRAN